MPLRTRLEGARYAGVIPSQVCSLRFEEFHHGLLPLGQGQIEGSLLVVGANGDIGTARDQDASRFDISHLSRRV